jgi:hypothetical protein
MVDEARNRLVKKRNDLKALRELLTHVHGRIFFKLLTCSPPKAFPPEAWDFLTDLVIQNQERTTPVPVEIHTNRVDPFPGGAQCLWWWGDAKGVEKFCQWADETAVALWENREFLPDLGPARGYYQTIVTLCTVAQEAEIGDPLLVANRVLLKTDEQPRLPSALARAAPPVTFHVVDVTEDGITFALDVLDHLLGSVPPMLPSARMDVAADAVAGASMLPPAYQFQLCGDYWIIRYTTDTGVEKGHYRDLAGFRHIAMLLANPEKRLEAMQLQGLAESPVAHEVLTPQRALDAEAVTSIEAELARLEDSIDRAEKAGNREEVSQLRQMQNEMDEWMRRRFASYSHTTGISTAIKRIADHFDPPPPDKVGSDYVAGKLGCTTTWVAEMVRNGDIPKSCTVPGTGNGKPWKFYRLQIDQWIESR